MKHRNHSIHWIQLTLLTALISCSTMLAADGPKKYSGSIDKGVKYLKSAQNEDGSWGRDFAPPHGPKGNVGFTSFIMYGVLATPSGAALKSEAWMTNALDWVLKNQREDGAFVTKEGGHENYQTSITVQTLVYMDKVKYKPQIDKAIKYILSQQFNDPTNPSKQGGIGYGSKPEPDMSNSQMALDALKAAGHDMASPEMKNLLRFIRRCQDDPEVNDQEWAQIGLSSGGAIYKPHESKAGEIQGRGGKKSWRAYGSMTYAMFKSYVYLELKKDSPELKSAMRWIRNEYAVSENPGLGQTGYFYYAHTMAKALRSYGNKFNEPNLVDANGDTQDWAVDLADEMVKRQLGNGSWVNEKSRWMEADPMLCTAYALGTLGHCTQFITERKAFE